VGKNETRNSKTVFLMKIEGKDIKKRSNFVIYWFSVCIATFYFILSCTDGSLVIGCHGSPTTGNVSPKTAAGFNYTCTIHNENTYSTQQYSYKSISSEKHSKLEPDSS
jgi:hypothetical protein